MKQDRKCRKDNPPVMKHSGCLGDIVAHLPCMIDIARREGHNTFDLYLSLNVPSSFGEPHPLGCVQLNREYAESMITLLEIQPYINKVAIWNGEKVDFDIDLFRLCVPNLLSGSIFHWPTAVFLCSPDLSSPWIHLPFDCQYTKPELAGLTEHINDRQLQQKSSLKSVIGSSSLITGEYRDGPILIARTGRNRNPAITYPRIGKFIGFRTENELELELCKTPTILDMSNEISKCKFLIGNNSLGVTLACALGIPIVLEVCPHAPVVNHIPTGSYLAWNQQQFNAAIQCLS